MNVLQINNYHYVRGGPERYSFELVGLLKRHGHSTCYFSVEHPENLPSEFSAYFGTEMSFDTKQSVAKKLQTTFRMLYSFENNNKMKRLLTDHKVDIAHAHNIYGRVCPSVLDVLRKRGIPIVMTIHDYKLMCPVYTLYRNGHICTECLTTGKYRVIRNRCTKGSLLQSIVHWLESKIHEMLDIYNKNVAFFCCPSVFSLKKHAEIGLPEERLVYLPNFVNVTEYDPKYEIGGYILFVGQLSRHKGILTLLRAVKGHNILVRVVGDGPLRGECERFARDDGVSHVIFEGYERGKKLRKLYQDAAFLVIPSEWYENAPMTILEAFAYGKPVIGSKIGGIPEMIESGRTGMLFTAGNADELRQCIQELWSKGSLVSEMGRAARHKVETKFSPEAHYKRLVKIYNDALNSKTL